MSEYTSRCENRIISIVTAVMLVALMGVFGYRILWNGSSQPEEPANGTTSSEEIIVSTSFISTNELGTTQTTHKTSLEDVGTVITNSKETTHSVSATTTNKSHSMNPLLNDIDFNYISYSKIGGVAYAINTAELYTWCGKKNYTSIKGDVRITRDGKLVMCHDAGFTLNENGKITQYDSSNAVLIRELSEKECLALRHENRDSPICSFDEYVYICKQYNKIAYITIRDEYMDEIIPEMLTVLRKYKMTERCIVNSFTYSTLQKVRKAAPSMMLSYVQSFQTKVTKEDVDKAAELGNCLVCGFNFSLNSTVQDVAAMVDSEVMAYAKEKGVLVYEAQVHSEEIACELKKRGITGVQFMRAPAE